MKKLFKILAVCAGVGAALGAAFCFRYEISDFVKKIIDKIESMRYCSDCCFDDEYDDDFGDFDDLDDVDE